MGSVFGRIDVECPAHTVLKTAPWGEVRSYPELMSIETNDASNQAFGKLAGFIGVTGPPKNDAAMPVAMTAPVVSEMPAGGDKVMSFVLPSSVSAPPSPTDPAVRVVRRPPMKVAVQRYSGGWDEEEARHRATALASAALSDGHKLVGSPPDSGWTWFRYNPPWTLPFLRTNEVAVELAD